MTNTTFHESYGTVTTTQLRAYKRNNVSPSDHDMLTDKFGDDRDSIIKFVTAHSPNRCFRFPMAAW